MKIIDCPQLSQEWWEARRGVPSASNFGRILTPAKRGYAKGARSYAYELIAELVALNPPWLSNQGTPFRSTAMQNGVDTEPEARGYYTMTTGNEVCQVGFCLTDDGRFGCSPDGLVGDEGGLELKCPDLKTQVEYLDRGVLPPEYAGQVHGQLIVTGRKWIDFLSYAPGLPAFLLRITPDDFTEALAAGLDEFWDEYSDLKRKFGLELPQRHSQGLPQ